MFGIEKLKLEVMDLKTNVELLNVKIRILCEDRNKFEDIMTEKVAMLDKLIKEYKNHFSNDVSGL